MRSEGDVSGAVMTIGDLAKRTGASVKELRRYEDLGFIYTVGRSPANYRLFDESALWCVNVVRLLRSLGLTLAEIGELVGFYLGRPEDAIGPRLAERLAAVRQRVDERIAEFQRLRQRIEQFQTVHEAELSGRVDFRETDPRFGVASG